MGQSIFDIIDLMLSNDSQFTSEQACNFLLERKERLEAYRHLEKGIYQPCVLRGNYKAFVVNGEVKPLPNGSGIDTDKSDKTCVVRYIDTGQTEMVSPQIIIYVGHDIS